MMARVIDIRMFIIDEARSPIEIVIEKTEASARPPRARESPKVGAVYERKEYSQMLATRSGDRHNRCSLALGHAETRDIFGCGAAVDLSADSHLRQEGRTAHGCACDLRGFLGCSSSIAHFTWACLEAGGKGVKCRTITDRLRAAAQMQEACFEPTGCSDRVDSVRRSRLWRSVIC
jgi:hypothetical protein